LTSTELSAIHIDDSADVRPSRTFADMPHAPKWLVCTMTTLPPVGGPASTPSFRTTGTLYDSADDKNGPLKPSIDANMLVKECDTDAFASKLEDDDHDENSRALAPIRNAALVDEVPKLEPIMVRRTHPVVGTLDLLTEEIVG